jgi:hypothetical protein
MSFKQNKGDKKTQITNIKNSEQRKSNNEVIAGQMNLQPNDVLMRPVEDPPFL